MIIKSILLGYIYISSAEIGERNGKSCEESGEGLLLCRMVVTEKDEVGVSRLGKI